MTDIIDIDSFDCVEFSSEYLDAVGINDFWSTDCGRDLFTVDLRDLARLDWIVKTFNRQKILEFGSGFSSKILADYIYGLEKSVGRLFLSIDESEKYSSIAQSRLSRAQLESKSIHFHVAAVQSVCHNGYTVSEYGLPFSFSPDFVYVDGPSSFVPEAPMGLRYDFPPITCDVLKLEYCFYPGTIILVDGRGTMAQYLINNFQRDWMRRYNEKGDFHLFVLMPPFVGKRNRVDFCKNLSFDKLFNLLGLK